MAIRRLIGSMRIVALLAIGLLASCGPIAIALGISEALKDEAPDLGPPSVRFFDATGFGAPPAFVTLRDVDPDDDDGVPDSKHVELMVRVDKPGVRVRVNVVGPFDDLPCPPFGAGDPADCPSPFPLTEDGVQAVGALDFLVTRPIGGLDGVYTLYVEIVDPKGRVISAAHQFLVDTTPPAAPGLIAVTARRPRALLVSWTTVQDLPERDNPDDDAVSGVAGYNIYFEVGPPEIAGATDPPDPTIEIPEEDEDDFLRSGLFPSANDQILESPHYVAGSSADSFELTGLFAGRLHSVAVKAVDRAGNESFSHPTNQPIDYRVVRTRFGGDGEIEDGGQQLDLPESARLPRLLDIDEDGAVDLLFVRGESAIEFHTGVTETDGVASGDRARPAGRFASAQLIDASIDPGHGRIVDLALADFDRDGTVDLLVLDASADGESYGLRFYRGESDADDGRGADRFVRRTTVAPRSEGKPLTISVGDINLFEEEQANSPLLPDVVVSRDGDEPVAWIVAEDFTFDRSFVVEVGNTQDVVLVDHNQDGYLDATGVQQIALWTILAEPLAQAAPRSLEPKGRRQGTASVGGEVDHLTSADFNGDGAPDFAISLGKGRGVSVLLRDGEVGGTGEQAGLPNFTISDPLLIGGDGGPIVVADFNADRIPDLAVASRGTQRLTICFGDGENAVGSGTFRIGPSTAIFLEPLGLEVADVDGNGTPDLVVTGFDAFDAVAPGRVLFLPVGGTQARGDGGFYDKTAEVPGFEVGTRTVDDIITGAASDLDQDGIQDLVVSATGEPLRILRGGGRNGQADGSFVLFASSAWRSSAGVDQFEVADFDGDGELDILGVRVGPDNFDRGDRVELQLKRGASFQHSWANWTQPRTIWGVDDIWCRQTVGTPKPIGVDMDRDGHLDLVSARCGVVSVVMGPFHPLPGETAASDELSYLNRSDALVYDHVFRTISGERVTSSIVVRDFNEDGLPDIVSLDLGLGTNVQVAYGQRNLTDAADLAGPSDFAIADGAGATTELFDPIGPWEYVLELTSSTAWASDAAIEVWWEEFEPQVAVADPDPQLHATPPASYRRIRRFAVVAGSFRFTVPAGAGPYVDGSVKARLLIVNHTGQSLPVGSVSLKRGKRFDNPARDFSVIQDLAGGASFDPTVRQHHTEIHDFDGDGVADIAVLTPQQQGLIVLRGQRDQGRPNGLFKAFDRLDPGDLSTMPSALYSFPTRPFQVRVADCNSDGIADLVVVRESSDNRSFDSALDVLFGIADANGRATGAFRAPNSLPQRVNPVTGFVLGDFNSDGIVDAAVGTSSAEQPLLLEGTGRLIVDETPEPEDD